MTTEYLNNKTFEGIIARFQKSKRDKIRYELIVEDLMSAHERQTRKKKSRMKDVPFYDQASEFLSKNVSRFGEVTNEYKHCQGELAGAFYTLSENIVRYAKFNLIDEQDAIQEGVMICFEKIDRFDPCKGKAFNYMTTCVLNHFRQLYRTARNYNELKKKYHDFLQATLEHTIIKNGKEVPVYKSSMRA